MSTHLTEHYFFRGISFLSELSLDLLQKTVIDGNRDLFLDSLFSSFDLASQFDVNKVIRNREVRVLFIVYSKKLCLLSYH